jgi:hypothetical protein
MPKRTSPPRQCRARCRRRDRSGTSGSHRSSGTPSPTTSRCARRKAASPCTLRHGRAHSTSRAGKRYSDTSSDLPSPRTRSSHNLTAYPHRPQEALRRRHRRRRSRPALPARPTGSVRASATPPHRPLLRRAGSRLSMALAHRTLRRTREWQEAPVPLPAVGRTPRPHLRTSEHPQMAQMALPAPAGSRRIVLVSPTRLGLSPGLISALPLAPRHSRGPRAVDQG